MKIKRHAIQSTKPLLSSILHITLSQTAATMSVPPTASLIDDYAHSLFDHDHPLSKFDISDIATNKLSSPLVKLNRSQSLSLSSWRDLKDTVTLCSLLCRPPYAPCLATTLPTGRPSRNATTVLGYADGYSLAQK
jgi:hypothetical protein